MPYGKGTYGKQVGRPPKKADWRKEKPKRVKPPVRDTSKPERFKPPIKDMTKKEIHKPMKRKPSKYVYKEGK
tara:strand:- start:278 stop:493 length:216 start_codon:yes stop_codon:yes gene_type:complete